MKILILRVIRMGGVLVAALLLASGAGCEDKSHRHDPAPGQGALVVDNRTGDGIRIYVDGDRLLDVDPGDSDVVDVDPGERRVAVIQKNGSRERATDVDILEGERTVMTVDVVPGSVTDYRVTVRFD